MLSWFSILFRGLWLSAWRSPYKDLRKCDTSIASPALLRFSRRDLAWPPPFRKAPYCVLLASPRCGTDLCASCATHRFARFTSSPRHSGFATLAPWLLAPLATARFAFRLPTPCSLHLTMKLASCRFGLATPRRYAIPFLELAALRAS